MVWKNYLVVHSVGYNASVQSSVITVLEKGQYTRRLIIANLSTVRPAIGLRFEDKGDTSQQNNPRSAHALGIMSECK